jgi:hypothetical protein
MVKFRDMGCLLTGIFLGTVFCCNCPFHILFGCHSGEYYTGKVKIEKVKIENG